MVLLSVASRNKGGGFLGAGEKCVGIAVNTMQRERDHSMCQHTLSGITS